MARRRSLHLRLSTALFGVIILLLTAEALFAIRTCFRLVEYTLELEQVGTVEQIARTLELHQRENVSTVMKGVADGLRLSSGSDLYLVDNQGAILATLFGAPPAVDNVDIAPIAKFADVASRREFPAFAADPRNWKRQRTAFVASRVRLNGTEAYLYLVLSDRLPLRMVSFFIEERLFGYPLLVVACCVILAATCAAMLYSLFGKRFGQLSSMLRSFAAGQYGARVTMTGDDELTELGSIINDMAAAVDGSVSELARRDQLRRELIANISHDLRGPATSLSNSAEKLSGRPSVQQDTEASKDCDVVQRNAKSLVTLLLQLYELAKLETESRPFDMMPFPVFDLASEIVSSYQGAAKEKGVSLVLQGSPEQPQANGDPSAIERVLRNLIENALTYTHAGGRIVTTVNPTAGLTADRCRIEVRDTGVGIAAADLPHVFDRSYRSKKWADLRSDSGGLGLAIVKRIVEGHGSRIELQSEENVGSCFAFELPLAASDGPK